MEETEEEEHCKTDYDEQFQQSQQTFQEGGILTTRLVRTTVRTASSISNVTEVVGSNLSKKFASLDEASVSGDVKALAYGPRSLSTSSLNKTSPDQIIQDVTIQELGKGAPEKKVYKTTALLDLGKPFHRASSVPKSNSIKEEGQDNVIITEPDDSLPGSLDRSEDSSYPISDDMTKSSHEDLPKGFLVAEERNLSHSAFQALSRSHGSLDETKLNMMEQKSMENLHVSGRKQILKGGILEEESTEMSATKGTLLRSNTGQENRQQWLTADTGAANVNSRSMESLREHRASFITSSEKDVRRIMSSSVEARSLESLEKEVRVMGNRYRRAVSGEDVGDSAPAEKKRGLFASARANVPSHLSLMPPQFVDRRLTILSPHSPMMQNLPTPGSSAYSSEMWQFSAQTLKTRRKKAVVLPRLVLPGVEDVFSGYVVRDTILFLSYKFLFLGKIIFGLTTFYLIVM